MNFGVGSAAVTEEISLTARVVSAVVPIERSQQACAAIAACPMVSPE